VTGDRLVTTSGGRQVRVNVHEWRRKIGERTLLKRKKVVMLTGARGGRVKE